MSSRSLATSAKAERVPGVSLTMNYHWTMNGRHMCDCKDTFELPAEALLTAESECEFVQVIDVNPAILERQKSVIVRWTGELELFITTRVSREAFRKALSDGGALEAAVEVPLQINLRKGKKILRDEGSRFEGVTDAWVAEMHWNIASATAKGVRA